MLQRSDRAFQTFPSLIYDWCFCDYGLVRSDLVLLYAIKKLTCGKDLGRVLDLRWLKPLNVDAVAQHAGQCKRILVLDEGRPDGGIGEGIVTALVERGLAGRPIRRITGKDCYIPLGDAAKLMLPDEAEVPAHCGGRWSDPGHARVQRCNAGVFKNALDWLTRPPKEMAPSFKDRPTALAGATPGGPGTTLAQAGSLVMLRQLKVHLRVSQAGAVLGDDGEVEQKTVMLIEKWLSGFCEFARRG